MEYTTIIKLVKEGDELYYLAYHPELKNCFSDGETAQAARENLRQVTEMTIEHLRRHNLPVPEPSPILETPQDWEFKQIGEFFELHFPDGVGTLQQLGSPA
ncbi:MAG: type II toxin-antitoxin system HicB family antitoxin [Chloroflexi bacterium]|nr:type II toxin-antitoxin system HicB family antitoxin [Chloroflexota bacterium]